jgi:hypothetical protein
VKNDRLKWLVAAAASSSKWLKAEGIHLGIELVASMVRSELQADSKKQPAGATPRERITRLATVLREVSDSILELVKDLPADPPPAEAPTDG